jgi:hypothetical protein
MNDEANSKEPKKALKPKAKPKAQPKKAEKPKAKPKAEPKVHKDQNGSYKSTDGHRAYSKSYHRAITMGFPKDQATPLDNAPTIC